MTASSVHILAIGGGVDSTALLALALDRRAAVEPEHPRAEERIPDN